jgi:hypothetical protein
MSPAHPYNSTSSAFEQSAGLRPVRLDLTILALVSLGKTCVQLDAIASRIEAVQKIALLVNH